MLDVPASRAPAGGWRRAVVREVAYPSVRAVQLRLAIGHRIDHLPGQHYVVRLTADDGYTASRSYSVASPPSDPLTELFVERLDDGEVSGYLADVVRPGDELDVRGPIGGWFVWDASTDALGVGGGTGVVPLVAMLRHARAVDARDRLRLVVAARTWADLPYADELIEAGATVTYSRENSAGRDAGRLTVTDVAPQVVSRATSYVCGSAGFAEAAGELLMAAGVPAELIRVERFGPSGS